MVITGVHVHIQGPSAVGNSTYFQQIQTTKNVINIHDNKAQNFYCSLVLNKKTSFISI